MIQYGCECNFSIAGVDKLPTHDHNQERCASDMLEMNPGDPRVDRVIADHFPLRDGVHIWVDWKAVAKA